MVTDVDSVLAVMGLFLLVVLLPVLTFLAAIPLLTICRRKTSRKYAGLCALQIQQFHWCLCLRHLHGKPTRHFLTSMPAFLPTAMLWDLSWKQSMSIGGFGIAGSSSSYVSVSAVRLSS